MTDSAGSVIFLVENLPLPFDRRVWLEATTVRSLGYTVVGISPAGRGYAPGYELREGIHLYRYPLPETATGFWPHVREYLVALWATARLTVRAARRHGVDVIHAANPPDLFFAIAWLFKPSGVHFVFDEHDLSPEVFRVQFGRKRALGYAVMRVLQWLSYRSADLVIATNETLRAVARRRGGLDAGRVTVVRTGPDTVRLHAVPSEPGLRRGRRFLVCYLGVMGQQDGVDYALRAARLVLGADGEPSTTFAFIGDGDHAAVLRALAVELGISDHVEFTGRVPDDVVRQYLSTADVCLSPDPANGFNEFHTMNKTLEYMAMGRAIVAFDLKETRASAAEAALYARPNDEAEFARHIIRLLRDAELRRTLGEIGIQRIGSALGWQHTQQALIEAYRRLRTTGRRAAESISGTSSPSDRRAGVPSDAP